MSPNQFTQTASERPVTMVTCYDAVFASVINETSIDSVLVGDSLGMVVHGFDSTVPVTVDIMQYHVAAVSRVLKNKLLVGDLPFLSYQQGLVSAMQAVQRLMQAGAHAVKLEGCDGHVDVVRQIVKAGVPVMGHLGLTPQSVHQLGGYKVQGRSESQAESIIRQAKELEQAGCFSIVLECVPSELAKSISECLSIPVIGIGAGPDVAGQVLVLHDLIGLQKKISPKFLKRYADTFEVVRSSLEQYSSEVQAQAFPAEEHTYA